jgi:hypothetical protein
VIVDQDVATNPLMAAIAELVGAGDDLDHPALRGPVRQARYQCIIDIAADNGHLGHDVVMIAPFTTETSDASAWSELARQLSPARVMLVWVTVPPDVAVARRLARNLPRDRSALQRPTITPSPVPVVDFVAVSGAAEVAAEARRVTLSVTGLASPTLSGDQLPRG